MTDDTSGLSRRKLLGSVATIGGAAALGGAGSVAFFSDREEFANNRLVAGSLDLKVDWAEYYSDWSEDEATAVDDGEIIMAEQDTTLQVDEYPSDYTGLPTPNNALIAIPSVDVGDFFDAAATEAYPDANDDGMVDSVDELEALGYDVCIHGADTPEDLDPTVEPESLDPTVDDSFKTEGTGLRTNNEDTVTEDGEPEPLIALDDVKPGDFGEVTISLHLCDNPGYIALTGEERYDLDNTQTEPEMKDPDEIDGLASGELGDTVRAAIWMDGVDENDRGIDQDRTDANGNNQVDDGEMFVVEEATLSAVVDALEGPGLNLTPPGAMTGDPQTGTFQCATTAETVAGGTGDPLVIQDPQAGDSFEVVGNSGNSTVTIDSVDTNASGDVVGFSFDLTGPDTLSAGDYPGVCTVTITGSEGTVTVDYGSGGCVRDSVLLPRPDQPDIGTIEEVDFDLCTIEVAEPEQEDPCFNGSDTYYLGFAWWVPVDHGNEIQTDSYGFDLGFYAEQCRHNPDGIGNVPEPEGE